MDPTTPPDDETNGLPAKRRWGRRLARVAAIVVLILVALPFIAWGWLVSSAGERFLRRTVLDLAANEIQGRLELDRVGLAGLLAVEVEGARLFAPNETEPALALRRAHVDVRLWPLLARRLELPRVEVDGPLLDLRGLDGETTNLARALAPKVPEPPKPPSGPVNLEIVAPSIVVRDGVYANDGSTPIRVEKLALEGEVSGTPDALDVDAKLGAAVLAPWTRELTLSARGRVGSTSSELSSATLATGASTAQLSDVVVAYDLSRLGVKIDALHLAKGDARQLLPELELASDVDLTGTARLEHGQAEASLVAKPAQGSLAVDLKAGLDIAANEYFTSWNATATATDIALETVLEGLPQARVNGRLAVVDGKGLPGIGVAPFTLDLSTSRYENLPLEVARAKGRLVGIDTHIDSLVIHAGGARLEGSGLAGARVGRLRATLDAPSIARLRTALVRGLGLALDEMDGAAALTATLDGPWVEPRLHAEGTAARFTMANLSLEGVTFDADLAHWGPGWDASARFALGALRAGSLEGTGLSGTAVIDGKAIRADVAGSLSGTQVALVLRGRPERARKAGTQRWVVDALQARALGVQMASVGASTIELTGGHVSIDRFELRGDLGRWSLSGEVGGKGPLDAAATIEGLVLARVPAILLPPELRLGGVLSADAKATGTLEKPVVDLQAKLANGQFRRLRLFAATADVRLENEDLQGVATLRLPSEGEVRLGIRLPLASPSDAKRAHSPVAVDLALRNVDVALLDAVLDEPLKLGGRFAGATTLGGSWAAPTLATDLHITKASGFGVDDTTFDFTGNYRVGRAEASLQARRGDVLATRLQVSAPLDGAALVRGEQPDWKTVPVDANVVLERLDLTWLARLGFIDVDFAGQMAGRAAVTGSMKRPVFDGTFALRDLAAFGYEKLGLTVDARARDRLELEASAEIAGTPLATLSAQADIAPSRVEEATTDELYAVPMRVDFSLAETPIARLFPKSEKAPVEGRVAASVKLTGTPLAPVARVSVKGRSLMTSGVTLDAVDLDARHERDVTEGGVVVTSTKAGRLVAALRMPGALGVKTLLAADVVDQLRKRNARISVDTEGLDLRALEGLVPETRRITGRMELHATKDGPLESTRVAGTLALRDFGASFVDYGEVSQTAVDAVFDWPSVEVKRFAGKSGTGSFSLTGDVGSPDGGKTTKGSVHLVLNEIPLVRNYQTLGYLSLDVDAQAEASERVLLVSPLRIAKGKLRIADPYQKDVQSLDAHPDIVFVDSAGKKPRREAAGPHRGEAAPTGAERPWRTEIRLTIPNDFLVEAPDLVTATVVRSKEATSKLTLGANLRITIDPLRAEKGLEPLDIDGRVNIVQGSLTIIRRFEVKQGRIVFRPGNFANPELDIEARHEGGDGTIVTVKIGGTAQNPTQRFESTPPMEKNEILFYLTTGRRQTRPNQTTPNVDQALASGAIGALSSLVGGGIKELTTRLLPEPLRPDVLSLDTDVSGGLSPDLFDRVRAGKYISDRIYVGGQYNRDADTTKFESLFEIEGQVQFTDETSVRAKAGQGVYGAEILYQKDFSGSGQKPATKPK